MKKITLLFVSALLSLFSGSLFAYTTTEGFGKTPTEAMAMARDNANALIANWKGEGCLGLQAGKDKGKLVKSTREEGGLFWVVIYVSEHAGSCGQKMNSVKIFGQDVKF